MSTITTQLNSNISVAYTPVCGGTTAAGPLQSVASIGNAGDLLTSNGAGNLPTFQPSSGGWTTTPITLTQSQIVNCHSSPVQLIAAQGANTIIIVLSAILKLVVSSVAYALTGNSLAIGYGTSSTTIPSNCAVLPILNSGFSGSTSTTLFFPCSNFTGAISGVTPVAAAGNSLSVSPINKDLTFTATTNNPTGGTGSGNSTLYVTYMVLSGIT